MRRPISGGQTLLPALKHRLNKPTSVVDLSGIAELKGIKRDGDTLVIGALAKHAEVANAAEVQGRHPGAGRDGRHHRRHPGAQPRHHRRQRRQQRPGGGLSCGGARRWAPRSSPTSARSRRTTSSRACSPRRSSRARSSPRSNSRSPRRPATPRCATRPAAMPWPASSSPRPAVGRARRRQRRRPAACSASPTWRRRCPPTGRADAVAGVKQSADGLNGDIHGSAEYRAHLVTVMAKRAVAAAG